MTDLTGILVVDKPSGWTSHDVAKKARNMLSHSKVGHTGTLDPFATGVLVLLVGTATKHAVDFADDDKTYEAEITFGSATDTYDCTGAVIATGDPDKVSQTQLEQALDSFRGDIMQTPPPYSAVKVNGKRLYKLARQGKQVSIEPRQATIYRFDADLDQYPVITATIACSKGTYIRAIAHDLGAAVGCPAHLSALRRTQAGRFDIADAIDFHEIARAGDVERLAGHLIPIPEKLLS